MSKGTKTPGDSAMIAKKTSAFFEKKGVAVSVRADRHGCSIYSEPEHRPIARLRIEGDDYVEVLWRYGSRWDKIGDFGGMRMSVSEAIKYIHKDPMNCFWPERRVKAVADAVAIMLGLAKRTEKKKTMPGNAKLNVIVTLRGREIIQKHTFGDPDFGRLARVKEGLLHVPMTLGEIEEIQGYVAAEANHTNNRKLAKELDSLFSKFQYYMDTYEEE